ncbi:MAG: pantoate--beta-alanine ligase [Gammaproteobacteria bacterium]
MDVISDTDTLRQRLHELRGGVNQLVFVPTMGNLHAGHAQLVRHARSIAPHVVVSIFVNPLQFGAGEDYAGYPSTLDADRELLDELGTDVLFLPGVEDIYAGGAQHTTTVVVPGLNAILEGEHRPTHFDGVSTVVAKLFIMVQPDIAVFGEKDYQQLLLIRKMVADLSMPVQIEAVATVRETDGLAMSSRNSYLGVDERAVAAQLHRTLLEVKARVESGEADFAGVETAARQQLEQAGFVPDYVSIRRASDLGVPEPGERELRVLAAARLGAARLIDNIDISIP